MDPPRDVLETPHRLVSDVWDELDGTFLPAGAPVEILYREGEWLAVLWRGGVFVVRETQGPPRAPLQLATLRAGRRIHEW